MRGRTLSLGNIQVVIYYKEEVCSWNRTGENSRFALRSLRYLPSSHVEKLDLQIMEKTVLKVQI